MKIRKVFIGLFASLFILCSCENTNDSGNETTSDDKTFFDITSFAVSNIEEINVSRSMRTSAAFLFESDDYSFLNTRYIKIDSCINELFNFSSTIDNSDDDAIVLSITTKKKETNHFLNMYLSYKTHYLYYEDNSKEDNPECYRSKNVIPDKYIDKLINQKDDGDEYYLTVNDKSGVSSGLPKSGYYTENHKFVFRVEVVTDVSFNAYLNDQKLTPFITGDSVGDYDCYLIEMPSQNSTLAISSDIYFANRDYRFDEIFSWVSSINEENVKSIRIETGAIGVDPDTATPEIRTSEDERDISYNLNILKNAPLEKGTYNVEGGSYLNITFVLEEFEYSINTNNNYICWNDFSSSRYFKIKDTFTDFFDITYAS